MSKRIKTIEQLEEYVGKGRALWFLSMIDAQGYADMSTREMSHMCYDGVFIRPMADRWDEVLSSLGESDDGEDLDYPTEDVLAQLIQGLGWV